MTSFDKKPDDYSIGQTNITDAVFMKSTVQMMVYNECLNRLNTVGMFRKAEVLEQLGLTDVAPNVLWDQIVKRLKAGLSAFTQSKNYGDRPEIELYPVANAFFKADAAAKDAMLTGVKTTGRQWDDSFPGRYLAGGYGKKTAGYVLAEHAHGRFAMHRADVQIQRINGLKNRMSDEIGTIVGKLTAAADVANVVPLAQKAGIPAPKLVTKPSK